MARLFYTLVAALSAAAAISLDSISFADTGSAAAPNGVSLPAGYRAWRLISVAREEGRLNDVRAILGNELAYDAARDGKPYPEGAIIARLAWSFDPLAESAAAFGQAQTHVSGEAKNGVQFMVKDSTRYASTGGWGFAQFEGGKPSPDAVQNTCFGCHSIAKSSDLVFSRFAVD